MSYPVEIETIILELSPRSQCLIQKDKWFLTRFEIFIQTFAIFEKNLSIIVQIRIHQSENKNGIET